MEGMDEWIFTIDIYKLNFSKLDQDLTIKSIIGLETATMLVKMGKKKTFDIYFWIVENHPDFF